MLKNHQVGFSIVEVMTVIAIIAVLVALALPSFNDYFEKARLRGAHKPENNHDAREARHENDK